MGVIRGRQITPREKDYNPHFVKFGDSPFIKDKDGNWYNYKTGEKCKKVTIPFSEWIGYADAEV